jgi:thiosulfate/3-mercaptopyruvate sulfurtransferase
VSCSRRSGTFVVAYADCGNLYAARLWHVLTHYGHDRVALLDGGSRSGSPREGRCSAEALRAKPAAFGSRESGWQRGIAATEILDRLEDPNFRLVDVRGPAEFSGEERRAARGGHIPGAVLWPWEGNLRPDGTVRAAVEIRARAQAAGLSPDHELVTYCQGGVRAAHAALVLRATGYQRVRIYDGSWAEWGNSPGLPIEAAVAAAA